MFKKYLSVVVSIVICLFLLSSSTITSANNPRRFNERFVIKSLQTILSAQATYQATGGSGDYGSNLDLLEAGLIDAVLANGSKYGYFFMFSHTPHTATEPSKFTVTAAPQQYGKSGKTSFYLDESGELRGADRNGGTAANTDPWLSFCADYENERCTISALRALHSAQITYQATVGNGNFGSFTQLYKAGLIRRSLSIGAAHGYNFAYQTSDQFPGVPASFKLFATPATYGTSGTRSFYIAVDGVLRGADKNGQRADENDPPL